MVPDYQFSFFFILPPVFHSVQLSDIHLLFIIRLLRSSSVGDGVVFMDEGNDSLWPSMYAPT